ncbi:MAG TPA: ferredoxin [Burkholderiales bacterium]|jgi:hypothetical protein
MENFAAPAAILILLLLIVMRRSRGGRVPASGGLGASRPSILRMERNCQDAPGDFYTTGECLSCEVPESLAPECLAPLDSLCCDTHFLRQPSTPEEIEQVRKAAESCRVGAIRYRGGNVAIRDRLGAELCD